MKNDVLLSDVMDSLDMAVLASKIELKYKHDVFYESIPRTFGELRQRLLINRNSPIFADLWEKYTNGDPITCYTSGTTGDPKAVTHPHDFWERHIRTGSPDDIWGLCYDPSHIAGIFVILQAFANGSKIVLLWDHENPSEEIIENRITHLSASSTFYRQLDGEFLGVKSVTIGSMRLLSGIEWKFPNARFRNIYATTEHGVIGVSEKGWYDLKPNMNVIDGELFVDGKSTGDMVVVVGDTFFIASRKGQFANVGGEKVYFEYVEDVLLGNNPGLKQVKVYSKPNSVTGEILVADVVGVCENFYGLQKIETPIINIVDSIETVNGKVKRC